MKDVLISIKPKWCELITSGEKTIEVRKTRPKGDKPFKVYIYCTSIKSMPLEEYVKIHQATGGRIDDWHGKVIGEFVCDSIETLDERALFEGMDEIHRSEMEEFSCLTIDELLEYKGNKQEIYGWKISDLIIYDKPKALSEFWVEGYQTYDCPPLKKLKRPPLSWCYVESVEGEKE